MEYPTWARTPRSCVPSQAVASGAWRGRRWLIAAMAIALGSLPSLKCPTQMKPVGPSPGILRATITPAGPLDGALELDGDDITFSATGTAAVTPRPTIAGTTTTTAASGDPFDRVGFTMPLDANDRTL